MAGSDGMQVLFGEDAVTAASVLNHDKLTERDPAWGGLVASGELWRMFRADEAALLIHDDGSWAVIEPEVAGEDAFIFVHGAYATTRETLVRGLRFLEKCSRAHPRCVGIRFGTHRKGWARLAPKLGYVPETDGYYFKAVA